MTNLVPEGEPDIGLATPLSLRTSFLFPLQCKEARREVLVGAALLFLPGVGWILNMGHRIMMVHRLMRGESAWPSWRRPLTLLWHGSVTFAGIVAYYAPAAALQLVAVRAGLPWLSALSVALFALATLAIPGFMTHYCRELDPAEIFNPVRALSRCLQAGPSYWRAWCVALTALAVSFLGLPAFGLGFLVTSVWFWQVAGFSFASVFSQRFGLAVGGPGSRSA